jgi:hypothetical protein
MKHRRLLLLALVAAAVGTHLYLISAAEEIDLFNQDAAYPPFVVYIRGRPPRSPAEFVPLRWLGLVP